MARLLPWLQPGLCLWLMREQEQVRSHQRHGSGYGWHVLELAVARALEQVVAQVQGPERRRQRRGRR